MITNTPAYREARASYRAFRRVTECWCGQPDCEICIDDDDTPCEECGAGVRRSELVWDEPAICERCRAEEEEDPCPTP